MNSGVIYLLTGPAHGVRLVVSLWTLRRHYQGPVTVYTTQTESHIIGAYCAEDPQLRVEHCRTTLVNTPRNASFLTKLELLPASPYEVTVYLDADTLIAGRVEPLLEAAAQSQFAATQFATWQACGRTVRHRLEAWRSIRQDRFESAWLSRLIDEAIGERPAVNGGVFAFQRSASLLSAWRELAHAGCDTFICDELALQMLLPRFSHQVLDCRFNCSPIYARRTTDVRVWHLHGEKHVRHPSCRELWWPAYRVCLAENSARLQEWSPGADRRLARVVRSLGA